MNDTIIAAPPDVACTVEPPKSPSADRPSEAEIDAMIREIEFAATNDRPGDEPAGPDNSLAAPPLVAPALSPADLEPVKTQESHSPGGDATESGAALVDRLLAELDIGSPNTKPDPALADEAVKIAQARLDEAIEAEQRLVRELRAAKEVTKLARRERDQAIRLRRQAEAAPAPAKPLTTEILEWRVKHGLYRDPEIKMANKNARQKRYLDRIKADPARAAEHREKGRIQKQEQRRRKRSR